MKILKAHNRIHHRSCDNLSFRDFFNIYKDNYFRYHLGYYVYPTDKSWYLAIYYTDVKNKICCIQLFIHNVKTLRKALTYFIPNLHRIKGYGQKTAQRQMISFKEKFLKKVSQDS